MLKKSAALVFIIILTVLCSSFVFAYDFAFETGVIDGYLYITGITGDNIPDTIVFPAEINGVPVKAIEKINTSASGDSYHAFDLKGAKNIVIENGPTNSMGFAGTENLETVVLPRSMTYVSGFANSPKLHSINLENAEVILPYSFMNCTSLEKVELSNVRIIAQYAFSGCTGLTEVDLTNAEEIRDYAFDGIENLTIYGVPGSVAETFANENGFVFKDSGKEKTEPKTMYQLHEAENGSIYISAFIGDYIPFAVQLPANINGTKAVGLAGFEKDGDSEILVPFDLKGITRLETPYKYADIGVGFTGTENLEYVSLPYVETIPDNAFEGAEKLSYINLKNVQKIGKEAFKGCTSLKEVDLTNVTEIGENAFDEGAELKIYGTYGSYAQEYAKEHGYTFLKAKYTEKSLTSPTLTVDGHVYTEMTAIKLNKLGVLKGIGEDENGKILFDTQRNPTRAEAVTMVVRMLGAEEQAQKLGKTHPFTDVPEWADGYVSYAYENGITAGVSDTLFDADSQAGPEMYLTFMLRVLGYTDEGENPDFSWENPWSLSHETGITEADGDYNGFDRGYMSKMTYSSMFAYHKGTDKQLFETLIEKGVFTADTWHSVWLMTGD